MQSRWFCYLPLLEVDGMNFALGVRSAALYFVDYVKQVVKEEAG
jgi:hypothetical protein